VHFGSHFTSCEYHSMYIVEYISGSMGNHVPLLGLFSLSLAGFSPRTSREWAWMQSEGLKIETLQPFLLVVSHWVVVLYFKPAKPVSSDNETWTASSFNENVYLSKERCWVTAARGPSWKHEHNRWRTTLFFPLS